ncbi:MAG: collagen-like protein [Leptolyngbya sp. RL_3_1]|nr:collagen-like protein [Leptolyngbya sp. RL_3_1]
MPEWWGWGPTAVDGGDGGNGGALTVYYRNPADLRQIYVDARGGRGGLGGRGGEGAAGCRCRYRDWDVQTCSGGTCTTERFICRDGDDGHYGRDGSRGAEGQLGALSLINQTEPLLPETPSQTQILDVLIRQPLALSRNLWQERSGATARLAPGSIVAETYREYVGRVEGRVQVVWEAPRSPNDFFTLAPTAAIQADGTTTVTFPQELWVTGNYQQAGDLTTYVVTGAVQASDATRLAWGTIGGQNGDFVAAVIDRAGESEYLNTSFHLTYRTANGDPRDDRRLRYTTQYEGTLPADLVTRDNDRFELALGRLPVSGRHLQGGTYVQMELTIQRSLGSNAATQTLSWQGRL